MAAVMESEWPSQPLLAFGFDIFAKFQVPALFLTPSAALTAASALMFYYYHHEPTYIHWSLLLWAKLLVSTCVVAFRVSEALTYPGLDSAKLVLSSLIVVWLTYLEHRRSVYPSTLFALLLVADFGQDVREAGLGESRRGYSAMIPSLKLLSISLQSLSKKHYVIDENLRNKVDKDLHTGIFRALSYLSPGSLKSLLVSLYQARVFMRGTDQLDRQVQPDVLLQQLRETWTLQKFPGPPQNRDLFIACLKTWRHLLLPLLLSRLLLTALKCVHPFVLGYIIETVARQFDETGTTSDNFVAFGCSIAVFLGTTLAQEHFSQIMGSYTARLRGSLIALQLDKLQRLAEGDAKNSASVALVSSDIDGIIDNIPKLLAIPVSIFELGVGSTLLSRLIDAPASIVCVPILLSSAFSYVLGRRMIKYFTRWNESINHRVSSTSRTIQQLTAIKMLGLGPTVCQFLEQLRVKEVQLSKPLGTYSAAITIFVLMADLGVPAVAIGAAMSGNYFDSGLTAAKVFPLLSVIFTIHTSLPNIISSMAAMMNITPCFARIQAFLCLPEKKDCRITPDTPIAISATPNPDDAIRFSHADISPEPAVEPVLRNVNIRLDQGSVTGVIGPHGAGKSTFIRAILGECELHAGSVQVNATEIGYCAEEVWLQEGTVRENIIGNLPFDAQRYEAVIRACFLEDDLEQLPGGDKYLVEARGSNLSAGQRQRIGIARAAYAQHSITVLDDVFRSLDLETAVCILYQLCGRDSLLRRAGCTIVVVTSLPQCLEVTDQLILLDGQGHATLDRSYRTEPYHQRFVDAMDILNRNNNALLGVEQRQQNTLYRYLQANSVSDGARSDEAQSIGDWSLVRFAIRPIGRLRVVSHTLLVFFFSAAELLPDLYLQYLMQFHPYDPSRYPTYASMTLITSLVSFLVYFNTLVILSPQISIGLHKILVQTLAGSTLGFIERSNEGHLLNLFSEDNLTISKGLPRSLLRIMYAGFASLLMVCIVLSGANYIVFSLPLVCALIVVRARRFCSEWREVRRLDNQNKTALCKFFEESSAGLTRLSIFYPSRQRQESGLNAVAQSQISYGRKFAAAKQLRRYTDVLGAGLFVIVSASALFVKGSSTASSVGLAYHVAVSFPRILYEAILAFANLDTSLDAVRRLREFQQKASLERIASDAEVAQDWPSRGAIELLNASVYYTPGANAVPAVSSVSLSISPGQHIGISGRLDSGKSSIVLMMLGFVRYEGVARIDGVDISSVAPQVLRTRLITIGKEPVIFEGSIRTNLLPFTMNDALQKLHATYDGRDAELEILLKRLHIWMPLVTTGGLDAIADDIGYSKGDSQLLCIARAILRQRETGAKVVILDDATSYLDTEREKIANDVMQTSFQACTVLRLSARQSGLEGAHHAAHLYHGEIVDPQRISDDSEEDEADE